MTRTQNIYMTWEEYKELRKADELDENINAVELQYTLGIQSCKTKGDVVELLKEYSNYNILENIEYLLDKFTWGYIPDKFCGSSNGGLRFWISHTFVIGKLISLRTKFERDKDEYMADRKKSYGTRRRNNKYKKSAPKTSRTINKTAR